MAESERDQVTSMLRACLLSTKGGIPVTNLERDYKMIVGSRIPYQKLGFQTLEQFLKSIPNVSISQDRNGQMILDAIPTKSTAHVAAMVSKQRSAPKRPARSLPLRRTAASSWRPPPSSVSVKPSRRPVSSRVPLSVTVSNRFDSNKGVGFEKSLRMVSFSNSTTSTTHSNNGRSTYEKPPRFLKLEQQENIASAPVAAKPVFTAPTPAAPASIPAIPTVPAKSLSSNSMSKAQDRLQQVTASLKNKNIGMAATSETVTSKLSEVSGSGYRTITSPLTPLQSRLNAAARKPQAPVLGSLEEKFASTSLGGGEDYTKVLEDFAQSKGMNKPVFKVIPRVSEGRTFYSCYVKIDDLRISSYPDERPSPREAMQLAAKQAFEELNELNSVIGGNATQDESIIMSRISHIVGQHCHGIWSTQIPLDYNNKYCETLPDDWLKIMSRCPLVILEHAAGNRIILTPNWPASPTEPTEHPFGYKIQAKSPVAAAVNPMDVHLGKPLLSQIGPAVPDPICLPKDDAWDVFVTCGSSTDEVWVRLIGEEYSVRYDNLATDMEMFYMGKTIVASNPEVDMFYAIKMDDCWHRVKVIDINETNSEARVFFIDHGDEEQVELKELHVLERRFAKLPAQAVLCYLYGLEDFFEDQNAGRHITNTIVGKALIASVKTRPSCDNPAVGVILFDTSTDEDLNLNTVLMESISKEAMAPQLPSEGKVKEVYISHVTDTGDIYLQFDTYSYLQTLVSNVVETNLKESSVIKGINNSSSNPNQLYLARYHLDGNWYRAAITKHIDAHKVEVIFVDFGNTELINQANLIVLDAVKKSVADFPHQAIKVHLQNVPPSSFSEHLALRVRELVPYDERVLVKTISFGRSNNTVPVVDIFKRIQPDNLLVSVNGTLAFEIDLKPSDDSRGKKRLERLQSLTSTTDGANMQHSPVGSDSSEGPSSRGLSPPQIPDIGEYFDVHVTMAANPGNFTVQPYKDAKRLEKMMEEMQTHYKEYKYAHPTADTVHEGGLFAALHSDGFWYRVCVSNVIFGNMISVYFCDYGDVSVLTVDKLQPLMKQFKELPYQAIKAKLAGIQPKHSDWSVEDCLMFQEQVVEHQFVSVIKETGPDLLNPSDTVIGLKLIDTSGEEDVYIDQVLIAQDRAVVTPVT